MLEEGQSQGTNELESTILGGLQQGQPHDKNGSTNPEDGRWVDHRGSILCQLTLAEVRPNSPAAHGSAGQG